MGKDFPKKLGFWCAGHRIDVVASAPEKQIAYVDKLLREFFRSLVRHIMSSPKSKGILEHISKLLFDESGHNDHSTSRSLAGVLNEAWIFLQNL